MNSAARNAMRSGLRGCQKTIKYSSATEQRGKSERGKKPLSRSIKQFSELSKFRKLDRQRGEKTFSTRWAFLAANASPQSYKKAPPHTERRLKRLFFREGPAEQLPQDDQHLRRRADEEDQLQIRYGQRQIERQAQ